MSTYNGIPEFDDPNAQIHERVHYVSGARIVEVLYGAKDGEGNPCVPKKDAEDGHGLYMAIETEGTYRMLLWQHPASEGGAVEYGDRECEDPLKALEEEIREKKAILDEARELMQPANYDTKAAEAVLERFEKLPDRNTPRERELKGQHGSLVSRNKKNEERYAAEKESVEKKRELISKAQSLQEVEDWNAATEQMRELMEQWKHTGRSGEQSDSLWEEFSAAQHSFYDRKHLHFEEEMKERIARKEQLIKEAAEAAGSSDWEATHQRLEELLARWKEAGSAGRKEDDRLWEEFRRIRNEFYERRNAARKERDAENRARRNAKRELIAEAQKYAETKDYSQTVADRMRAINEDWKKIGSAGRRDEETLWKQLREAQDAYWQGKRQNDAGRHQQWMENTREAIARRRKRIENLSLNLEKLRERVQTTQNEEKREQISGWISENEEQIRSLEEEIERMEAGLKKTGDAAEAPATAAPAEEAAGAAAEAPAEEAAGAAAAPAEEAAGAAAEALAEEATEAGEAPAEEAAAEEKAAEPTE